MDKNPTTISRKCVNMFTCCHWVSRISVQCLQKQIRLQEEKDLRKRMHP